MSAVDPSHTPRVWVQYTVGMVSHEVQMRHTTAWPVDEVAARIVGLFTALEDLLPETVLTGAQFAEELSNVRNDVEGFLPVTVGTGSGAQINRPAFISFVGRGPDGRRLKHTIYGLALSDANYRITTAESSVVNAVVDFLNTSPPGLDITVFGSQPVWKGYANTGFNRHWVNKVRRSG